MEEGREKRKEETEYSTSNAPHAKSQSSSLAMHEGSNDKVRTSNSDDPQDSSQFAVDN